MGRPKEFEPEETLEQIMNVFWLKGYEGASLHDIEAATGLKKPSLYRTFGDKRAMYLAALAAYDEMEAQNAEAILHRPGSARTRFQRLLRAAIDGAVVAKDRRGCFLCNASVDQAPHDPATQKFVSAAMDRLAAGFADALAASPPYAGNPRKREKMAAKILAGYFGLRVLIKAGVPLEMLEKAASQIVGEIET